MLFLFLALNIVYVVSTPAKTSERQLYVFINNQKVPSGSQSSSGSGSGPVYSSSGPGSSSSSTNTTNGTYQTWPFPLTKNDVKSGNYSIYSGPALLSAVSADEIVQIVNAHNKVRNQLAGGEIQGYQKASNMLQLIYNTQIAQYAQTHAQGCQMSHGCNGCGNVQQHFGQNLYWGPGATFEAAIQSWFDEYKIGSVNPSSFQFNYNTGHFTQVGWATTGSVGCGAADCNSMRYIVCNYLPAGNMIGGSMYKTGTPCSACPSGTSCSSKDPNYENYANLCKQSSGSDNTTSTTTAAPVSATPSPINIKHGNLTLECTVVKDEL